jgi:DNA-binding transcriptional regulator YiaG
MSEKLDYQRMVDVAAIRADHGLTIKEIANLLGAPISTYTQWEYGDAQPSGAALSLLLIMAARPDVIYEVLGPLEKRKRGVRRKLSSKDSS